MEKPDTGSSSAPPLQSPKDKFTTHKVESTPRSLRSAGLGDQTALREEIAQRMGTEMLTCDFTTFCNHYLPFCPTEADVESAIELLIGNGILSKPDPNGAHTWNEFYEKPSQMSRKEDDIFGQIEDISRVLLDHKIEGRSSNFVYRKCPNNFMKSDIEGGNFKVDGCFELAGTVLGEIHAANTAVLAEYKKYEAHDVRNRKQMLSAANHIMNDDPRRSAVYGITIVDDKMSLWYFSRSHSVKSDEFSFMEEYRYMVLSLLSFIFATGEEVGYEPKVLRRTYQDRWCYIYEINGRLFRTEGNVFSYRSLCITGRNTCVWKAVEVKNLRDLKGVSGPVAIKDVWLDKGAKTEHEVQEQIFIDIEETLKKDSVLNDARFSDLDGDFRKEMEASLIGETYKRHFMNIKCSELGVSTRERAPEATPITGLFEETADLKLGDLTRMYAPKQHYLVVYAEVAKPLDEANDLCTAFRAIKDALVALMLLYLAGWVHRDISTGNILFTEINGTLHAKLSDLEYSKRFGETGGSSDPKTGTPYFMALEIALGRSLYLEEHGKRTQLLSSMKAHLTKGGFNLADTRGAKIFYNYQHDLESLWWIVLWFLLCRVKHEDSNNLGRQVFTSNIRPSEKREKIFTLPGQITPTFHPCLNEFPALLAAVSHAFTGLYVDRGYAQRDAVDLNEDYSPLFSGVWLMLQNMIERLQQLDVGGQLPALHDKDTVHVTPRSQGAATNVSGKKRLLPTKEEDHSDYAPSPTPKRHRNNQIPTKVHRTRGQTRLSNQGDD